MKSELKKTLLQYGWAVATVALATGVRLLAGSFLTTDVPFITYFPAVFAAAFFLRLAPTLLAVVLSALVATFLFIPPAYSLAPGDFAGWRSLILFVSFGAAVALLSHQTRRRAEQILSQRTQHAAAIAEQTRLHQQWYEVTLASIGDAVIATDAQGRVRFLNRVAEQLTGWAQTDAQGQPLETVFEILHEQTREPVENPVAKVLKEGRVVGLGNHTVLIAKDGAERPIDDSAAPIRSADGELIGIVLVFRDVTVERKSHNELRRSEALKSAVLETALDCIITMDHGGKIVEFNPAAEKTFGYPREQAIGRELAGLIIPPALCEQHRQGLRHYLATGEGPVIGQRMELSALRSDGTEFPVELAVTRNTGEGPPLFTAYLRDITEWKATQQHRTVRLAVNQVLTRGGSEQETVLSVLQAVCESLGWEAGFFWRVNEERDALECRGGWHQPHVGIPALLAAKDGLWFARGEGLPGQVWATGEALWLYDVMQEGNFPRIAAAEQDGLHSAFACPIVLGDQTLGVMEFFTRRLHEPDDNLMETMETLAGSVGQAIERRHAEDKLRGSEQDLSDFFDNAAVGLLWVGPDGTILRANQSELDLLGHTPEEYVGRNIAEFHADQDVIDDILKCLTSGEELHGREARLRCKDGSIKHVLIDSNVYRKNGQFIHTRCFTRDITDRKLLEQSLHFLAEASKSLSLLVDFKSTLQKVARLAVPDFADWCSIDMLDKDGTLERLAVAHLDPAKGQWEEEHYHWLPPDTAAPRGVTRVLRTGETQFGTNVMDDVLKASARDDGHLQWLRGLNLKSYICVPLRHKETTLGVITFVAQSGRRYNAEDLALAEDLGHRAAVAIDNARLYQELRDADRRKDEFLAMLAHELRNPLAPIRSGLDILALHEALEQDDTIQLMRQQVEHLVRLVDDLLDVSRIMRGRIELRRESVSLSSVVQRSVATVDSTLADRQQTLSVSLPSEPIWLRADPVRLAQVLENLLSNASKYSDVGGQIELTAELHDAEVVLRVRDDGVGIEPELLPKVFDLFSQSTRTLDRSQGGLGIGLTLVKNLVAMHGGRVAAHSEGVGKGTEFVVYLPTGAGKAATAPPTQESPAGVAAIGRRVLVVDDMVGAARVLARLLCKFGPHEVQTAYDGETALVKIREFQPEIVLLDIGLPRMNGYQVARRLRDDARYDGMLLVALTGYGQAEDRRRTREAGFDEHLVKPPAFEEFERLFSHPKLSPQGTASPISQRPTAHDDGDLTAAAAREQELPLQGGSSPPDLEDWHEALHEFGNHAHALALAAAVLESASDGEDHEKVRDMLDRTTTSMHELVKSLRKRLSAADE